MQSWSSYFVPLSRNKEDNIEKNLLEFHSYIEIVDILKYRLNIIHNYDVR